MNRQGLIDFLKKSRSTATDDVAAKGYELYPELTPGLEVTQEMVDCGRNRFRWNGKLYKVPNPIQKVLDNWMPDKAPSLYEAIDVVHLGTADDPIEYNLNMVVLKDKYYTYDGIKYLCIRDSGTALQNPPDQLIGHYFTEA